MIYVFINNLNKDINNDIFASAMKNTFEKRSSLNILKDYKTILNEVKENERLNGLWTKYTVKRYYTKDIKFPSIIETLDKFLTKCVNTASIPFKIAKENPNDELLEAIREEDQILEDLKSGKRKGYDNVYQMFKEYNEEKR